MHGSVLSVHSARVLPEGNISQKATFLGRTPKSPVTLGILARGNFSPRVTVDPGSTVSRKATYIGRQHISKGSSQHVKTDASDAAGEGVHDGYVHETPNSPGSRATFGCRVRILATQT